ncbi:MAG: phosphoglycerate dehydrogenase [Exiguobacterium sp.]|uniref:phosphoglycerate dehydrogenase n=1 Tax=Exiguobacterium TaxID=33986 RepID=UPI0004A9A35D|nr:MULTISPECIES: phosphoglycerate dehydrogenase [unclassified Exiguobacterium]KDN57263.1 3-phosphoglycerate dehydrogenase [Exiguobacterium sp. AB2]MDX5322546.1 phosphoglycerate dehydrogenase [Exiguobacterium sp.]MDX5424272.1 phosphoglycerate dehydrogenase [Exiguobacterium sp.]MDX6771791.1 phosphoglycerate dehydrogenase [Exiguobacterium sp.]
MFHIKTYNQIAQEGLNRFEPSEYALNASEQADAWVIRSHDVHEAEIPPYLLAIARAGAGVNNLPLERLARQGVVVFHTPGANANAVKELVLASMLLSVRPILQGVRWVNEHTFNSQTLLERAMEDEKRKFVGAELRGKKVGIVGLGAIGSALASDLIQLGVDVVGYDPHLSVDGAWNVSKQVKRARHVSELLADIDLLSIHMPLTADTRGIIDASWFNQMKPRTTVLNFARGELVNDSDLLDALDGNVETYITDFPKQQLLGHPRIVAFPHLGASTKESEVNCAVQAVDTLKSYLETGNIRHSANFPDTELPYIGKRRLAVLHLNVPNMVGQIASRLAENGINIDNMVNRSRGDVAYTLIDIDNHQNEKLSVHTLYEIEGVMRVREF